MGSAESEGRDKGAGAMLHAAWRKGPVSGYFQAHFGRDTKGNLIIGQVGGVFGGPWTSWVYLRIGPNDKQISDPFYRGVFVGFSKRMAMHFAEEHAYLYLIMEGQTGRVPVGLRLSFARQAATAAVKRGLSDRFREGLVSYATAKG